MKGKDKQETIAHCLSQNWMYLMNLSGYRS